MTRKWLQANERHEIVRGVYVCTNCGRYRVEKVIALPQKLPDELKAGHEYCPVCESNPKFMKIK